MLEYDGLIIARADGEHEADRTPAAAPDWIVESMFPCEFPYLRCIWVLFLLAACRLTLPHSDLMVLADCGNHIAHKTNVTRPCYIAHPIVVGLLLFTIAEAQFTHNLKFLRLCILFPNVHLSVHTTRHESFWSYAHFILCILLLVNLLSEE